MSLLSRLSFVALIVLASTLGAGCAMEQNNSSSTTVSSATPAPTTTASPVANQSTAKAEITLPVLDALLSEEPFKRQLKTKAKLTDEQIDSLKKASQAEIDRLRESNAEETDGTNTDAPTRTREQLRSILGDEKASQVAALANEYWAKGDQGEGGDTAASGPEMLKGPNAVPTDTRIVVNIPAFRMDLFQNGSLVKTYKVGIGYPEFPLPQGLRKAQTIIFNPAWTPPDSPWVATMKNVAPGETVEPGSKDNPLGPIKIPIGLPSLIHGGKSPARIGKFASHGCVGLTNAQIKDFATLLMQAANGEGSASDIDKYFEDKTKTKTVKLKQVVPVELRYETIVVEDGKLHIYKDVYAQDTNTEEKLRAVLEAHGIKLEDLSEEQRRQALDALNTMSTHPQPSASASPSATAEKKTAKTAKTAKTKASQNEVVIDLGGTVAQKGYPAPVNLDEGKGKPAAKSKRT
jgi:lipoprotein-anchoring transpeptidase ErfK/SrfK